MRDWRRTWALMRGVRVADRFFLSVIYGYDIYVEDKKVSVLSI